MSVTSLPIVSQLSQLFGLLMRGLYIFSLKLGIENILFSIVLFVFITKLFLLPNTYSSIKATYLLPSLSDFSTRLDNKYLNKLEHPMVSNKLNVDKCYLYGKYNLKQSRGCTATLIQLPVVFALYAIIQDVPKYVPELNAFSPEKIEELSSIMSFSLNEVPGLQFSPIMIIPILSVVLQFVEIYSLKKLKVFASRKPEVKIDKSTEDKMLEERIKEAEKDGVTIDKVKVAKGSMKIANIFTYGSSLYFACIFPLVCSLYWVLRSVIDIVTKFIVALFFRFKTLDYFAQAPLNKLNRNRKRRGLEPLTSIM